MTKVQETIAISMAVTAVMGTMFVLIGIWSANRYTRGFVKESIRKYDSSVVSPHIEEYRKSIDTLNRKADYNIEINKEILKTIKEWKNQ